MKNIMVDLETMGNGPDAAIISIGAVYFGEQLGKTFYTRVSLESCIQAGLKLDSQTIVWWMSQSDQARAEFKSNGEARGLSQALSDFSDFLEKDALIWGNGSDFDNAILANAYKAIKCAIPWKFWNNRCFRTLKALFPQVSKQTVGVAHNALDDAVSQANHAMKIFEFIKERNNRVV